VFNSRLLAGVCAGFVIWGASPARAGIAFQSYNPGQDPVDYSATTLNYDRVMISGEGGTFPSTTGAWFSFAMPHAGAFNGITVPLDFITAPTNTTINFGFWLGTNPTGSTVGGQSLPVADIVPGQTKEYSFDFAPGYQFSAGQNVTIAITVVGGTGNATIDGFLSNLAGATNETSLGVIFDPTPLSKYPAIQIRDTSLAPEPAATSLGLMGLAMLVRRRRR
jgi:MYXO-CTERM domain-containing protein